MDRFRAPRSLFRAAALAALPFTLAACEDEIVDPADQFIEGQETIDASSPVTFAYFTFADGGSLVSVTDPSTSTDWDMAFRRFGVKLNGGVAGPGSVAGANLGNNAAATDTDVVQFTPADAEAAFAAVTETDINGVTFVEDGLVPDDSGPWFRFDFISGNLVANPGAAWKVQEADGGFSVFRVSELVMNGQAAQSVTIEYRHQDAGGSLGAVETVQVDVTMGPGFVDLASGTTVSPAACDWDLSVAPSFMIEFNDACSAGTFPLDPAEDFTAMTTADDAPEYGGFLSTISGAFPGTIDDATGVFWYNIEGNQRLWPTHNVFLVRVDDSVYKVQVVDYYSATGDSGHPTVRFEQIR